MCSPIHKEAGLNPKGLTVLDITFYCFNNSETEFKWEKVGNYDMIHDCDDDEV